jgi:Secretion system C-terminal sorting domain/BNR/Asp-box repeat
MKKLLVLIILLAVTFQLGQATDKKEYHSYKLKELEEKKELLEEWLKSGKIDQLEDEHKDVSDPVVLGDDWETQVTTKQYIESEVASAINPTDSNNIIISPIRQGYSQTLALICPVYYTKDFGKTWHESEFITKPKDIQGFVLGGGDPVFAFDKSGKAYLTWIYLYYTMDGNYNAAIFWAYSTDGGETWQEEASNAIEATSISSSQLNAMYDKQWMACDLSNSVHANNLYMSVSNLGVGNKLRIECIRKEANNSNFEKNPSVVSTNGLANIQFSSITVDTKGDVHVTYYGETHTGQNPHTIYHASSHDGGKTFSASNVVSSLNGFFVDAEQVTGITDQRSYPSIYCACDQSEGDSRDNLYVVWAANGVEGNEGNGMNIYFSKSIDGGKNWGDPKMVNKVFGEKNDCFHPAIAVNPDGVIVLSWYDRTADLENNRQTHYHLCYSFDAGETFTDDFPVTSQPTDFRYIGNGNNGMGILEYTQIVTTKGYAIPVWADGRTNTGDIDIYVAFVPLTEDVTSVDEVKPINNSISIQSISPNPASNMIKLDINSDTKLNNLIIYDLAGTTLIKRSQNQLQAGQFSLDMNIDNLNTGTYFVRIENEHSYAIKKLVVAK